MNMRTEYYVARYYDSLEVIGFGRDPEEATRRARLRGTTRDELVILKCTPSLFAMFKEDRDVSMYEARRELIWRGSIVAKMADELRVFTHDDDEVQLILDNWMNFLKAFWTRSGKIDGVPEDLVKRLITGMSSAGDFDDLDRELERFRKFRAAGLTELSLRLFDYPMDGLKMIGEKVLPALR